MYWVKIPCDLFVDPPLYDSPSYHVDKNVNTLLKFLESLYYPHISCKYSYYDEQKFSQSYQYRQQCHCYEGALWL